MHTIVAENTSSDLSGPAIPPLRLTLPADQSLPAWPAARGFTGRARELKIARYLLEKEKILVITGAFAVGKTFLVQQLGQSYPADQRLWVKCDALTNLSGLAQLIAARIADRRLQDFLEADRATPYPGSVRVAWLAGSLAQWSGQLLCLDNVQAIDRDPEMVAWLDSLASRIANGQSHLRLIVTSRRPPPFLSEFGYMELSGIETEATPKLYSRHHISPTPLLAEETHTMMGGSAGLIDHTAHRAHDLFVAPLAATDSVPRDPVPVDTLELARRPLQNPHIRESLHDNAFADLTEAEKIILYALALFDEPVSPEWVKAAVEPEITENPSFVLYRLQSQGLVVSPSPFSELLTLTPVIRAFYREKTTGIIARRLHHNLAAYLAWEGQVFEALPHYIAAQESNEAAALVLHYLPYANNADEREAVITWGRTNLLRWPTIQDLSEPARKDLEALL